MWVRGVCDVTCDYRVTSRGCTTVTSADIIIVRKKGQEVTGHLSRLLHPVEAFLKSDPLNFNYSVICLSVVICFSSFCFFFLSRPQLSNRGKQDGKLIDCCVFQNKHCAGASVARLQSFYPFD